jgi:hypothetical protein
MSYTALFLKKMKNLEEENKKLREFKERTEEECGAHAVMNDLMDRIQDLENENKEIKEKNNKQQVVIVNETIEKEKAQIQEKAQKAKTKHLGDQQELLEEAEEQLSAIYDFVEDFQCDNLEVFKQELTRIWEPGYYPSESSDEE